MPDRLKYFLNSGDNRQWRTRWRVRRSTWHASSLNSTNSGSPKIIAEMNDYQFKVVKLLGDFVWHDHQDTDETFIVVDGVCASISATARCVSDQAKCSSCPRASSTSLMRSTRSA